MEKTMSKSFEESREILEEKFPHLFKVGYTLQEIADELGVSYSVAEYFLEKKLKSGKLIRNKKKFVSIAQINRDNLRMAEVHTAYNDDVRKLRKEYLRLIENLELF